MKKKKIIENLRAAKSAHIKWRSYAQALVAGIPVDDSKIPVIHTDCKFGQWYYGEGQCLSSLPTFDAIAEPHELLHRIYMDLFKHLFHEEQFSLFDKLMGKKAGVDGRKQQIANEYLDKLVDMSKTLMEALELLEKEVIGMSDEEIAELV